MKLEKKLWRILKKKVLFNYFDKHNCLYLLSDTLDFLKDKDMAKVSYGNKAHPYSQKVYTPNGIKQWGDIKIGDKLFGSNNKLTAAYSQGEALITVSGRRIGIRAFWGTGGDSGP